LQRIPLAAGVDEGPRIGAPDDLDGVGLTVGRGRVEGSLKCRGVGDAEVGGAGGLGEREQREGTAQQSGTTRAGGSVLDMAGFSWGLWLTRDWPSWPS
jgi:hypothetical protein